MSKTESESDKRAAKVDHVKRMLEEAARRKIYGTLEIIFEDGIPHRCRKIESFLIPE